MHILQRDYFASENFRWNLASATMEALVVGESSMLNGKAPKGIGKGTANEICSNSALQGSNGRFSCAIDGGCISSCALQRCTKILVYHHATLSVVDESTVFVCPNPDNWHALTLQLIEEVKA